MQLESLFVLVLSLSFVCFGLIGRYCCSTRMERWLNSQGLRSLDSLWFETSGIAGLGGGGARDKGTGPGGTFPLTRGQGLLLSVGTEQQQNGEPRGNVTTDASCTWMTSVKSQAASPAVPLPRLFLAKHPLLLSRQQLTSRGR